MNTTPLRLVAVEDSPAAEGEQSGVPVTMVGEQDAITRKVPEFAMIAAQDTFRDEPERPSRFKALLPAGAVAIVIVAVVVALAIREESTAPPARTSAIAAPVLSREESPQPQPSAPPAAPATAPLPPVKTAPEVIRLSITAEPLETELSLDGNVLAGHRLNLEVPKDRGIHVLSASAPGYIPFNQQVGFSSDVLLKISLRRSHAPFARQVTRSRPSQIEPRHGVGPAALPPGPGLEPGMKLDGPVVRQNAKPIDERNPYKP